MSEPTNDTIAPEDVPVADSGTESAEGAVTKDWEAEANRWKELSRKNEAAAKDARSALAELQGVTLRAEVARAAGLPVEMSDRLRGSSEAELVEDAAALVELMAPKAPGLPAIPGVGRGASSDIGSAPTDPLRALTDQQQRGGR